MFANHPTNAMYVLNTILGGYFGSRLMENIREDKGYTYNVYSLLDSMRMDGCFYIGTEVSNDFVDPTIEQIYLELERLIKEPIPEEELTMVRSYLMGYFLTMLDGPFNVAELVKTQIIDGLPDHFFNDLVRKVKQISAEELQTLAQKYFVKDELWEVVVG